MKQKYETNNHSLNSFFVENNVVNMSIKNHLKLYVDIPTQIKTIYIIIL